MVQTVVHLLRSIYQLLRWTWVTPNLFQEGMIRDGLTEIHNLLSYLGITDSEQEEDIIKEYRTPESGIVLDKSVSPVNQAGGRILHLGIK